MADELGSWLAPPSLLREPSDIGDLMVRVVAAGEPGRQSREANSRLVAEIASLGDDLRRRLEFFRPALSSLELMRYAAHIDAFRGTKIRYPEVNQLSGAWLSAQTADLSPLILYLGFEIAHYQSGLVQLTAAYFVRWGHEGSAETIWAVALRAPLGSARLAAGIDHLFDQMVQRFREAFAEFTDRVETRRRISDTTKLA